MAGTNSIRKFSTTFYQDKSGSDNAQIPADGAAVFIYKQGATKSGSSTVTTGGTSCTFFSVGRLLVGDIVQKNGTGTTMTVTVVTDDTHATLAASSGTVSLNTGDRLVVTTPVTAVGVYLDAYAIQAAPNPFYLPPTGLFEVYVAEIKFDVIVNGALYFDNDGGWTRGGGSIINVKDYATPQAAINALPSGVRGEVYFPAGSYSGIFPLVTNATGTHLRGERGFTIFSGTKDTTFVQINHFGCSVSNFTFSNPSPASGTGTAVEILGSTEMANTFVQNCSFDGMGKYGVDIRPASGHSCYFTRIQDCDFTNCWQGNVRVVDDVGNPGSFATSLWVERCHLHAGSAASLGTYNGTLTRGGIHVRSSGTITFNDCYFEYGNGGTTLSFDGNECNDVNIMNSHWEITNSLGAELGESLITTGATMKCLHVQGAFISRKFTGAAYGCRLFKNKAAAIVQQAQFQNCFFYTDLAAQPADDISLNDAADYAQIIGCYGLSTGGVQHQIGITDKDGNMIFGSGSQPILKVGRTSATANITNPVEGMIIFDTSAAAADKLKVYVGGNWRKLTSTFP